MNYDDNEKKLGVTSSSLHFLIQPLINSCELKLATCSAPQRVLLCVDGSTGREMVVIATYSTPSLDKLINHVAL